MSEPDTIEASLKIETEKARLQKEVEYYKATLAKNLENQKADTAISQTMLSAGVSFANTALRALLLINGGAVLSILTFVGNLVGGSSAGTSQLADRLATAVWWFTSGLIVTIAATCLAYVSQTILHEARSRRWGWWAGGVIRATACVCALGGLFAFAKGANLAAASLRFALP